MLVSDYMFVILILYFTMSIIVEKFSSWDSAIYRSDNHDLVLINGEYDGIKYDDEVGLILVQWKEWTRVGMIVTGYANNYFHYSYKRRTLPNALLRAYFIQKSRNRSSLTQKQEGEMRLICSATSHIIDDYKKHKNDIRDAIVHLAFGIIAKKFGITGFYYAFTDLMWAFRESANQTQSSFGLFYDKYLRLRPRSLADSDIALSVQKGDLVRIRGLKPQKNESLQARAAYFYGSFGRIITSRKNKRNQTEYPIQSLFDKDMKLALRPKYLFKITKIHVHRMAKTYNFSLAAHYFLYSLLDGPNNQVLYLPHFVSEGGGIIAPSNEIAVIMLQNYMNKSQIISDIAIHVFLPIILNIPKPIKALDLSHELLSFPFYFDEGKIWKRVKETMMKNVTLHSEKILIQRIDTVVKHLNDYWQSVTEWRFEKLRREIKKISKCLGKHQSFFHHLLIEVRNEMLWMIQEFHPDYFRFFDPKNKLRIVDRLKALYRVSVIQNYLKACSKGQDLHVVCYQDEEHGLMQNLSAALAEKINIEWAINNINASMILADAIIRVHQH